MKPRQNLYWKDSLLEVDCIMCCIGTSVEFLFYGGVWNYLKDLCQLGMQEKKSFVFQFTYIEPQKVCIFWYSWIPILVWYWYLGNPNIFGSTVLDREFRTVAASQSFWPPPFCFGGANDCQMLKPKSWEVDCWAFRFKWLAAIKGWFCSPLPSCPLQRLWVWKGLLKWVLPQSHS